MANRFPVSGSGPGRSSSRTLIIAIGCVILIALAAAMLMHSNFPRPSVTPTGRGAQTDQR